MLSPASVELSVTSPDTWRTVVKGQTLQAPQNWYSLLLVFGGKPCIQQVGFTPFRRRKKWRLLGEQALIWNRLKSAL